MACVQCVTRQIFSEQITGTELPLVTVARHQFDMNLVVEQSEKSDLTIILGQMTGPDMLDLGRIRNQTAWIPDVDDCAAQNDFDVVRRERSVGCLNVAGASLVPPNTGRGREAPGEAEAALSDSRMAAFRRDAEFLRDVSNRRPADGQITLVATAGHCPPLLATGSDIRETLRQIGGRIERELRIPSTELSRLSRAIRCDIARYAAIHVDRNGVWLPQMPLLPVTVKGNVLLGARFDMQEIVGENVTSFSVADMLFRRSPRFLGKEEPILLRDHVFIWARAVNFASRFLSDAGHTGVIEALPISALGSAAPIPIGVFIQDIDENRAREIGCTLNEAISQVTPGAQTYFCVAEVGSVEDVASLVKVLDKPTLDLIASVVSDHVRETQLLSENQARSAAQRSSKEARQNQAPEHELLLE
ncbi:hypothetical protein SAMN04487926_14510 [Paraburkholderia steynii]|uniref:Uncharacterized protein n=1 Tax=Paraburkholderia steynii TaxID=1245441 RepID=A0A7Z7BJ23_9BURK|nr:hypothetical protein [Paraburkholderia steynii]SDJ36033.1 hypothetical protein SAMN04487926_14510 [Paraburkholderia steynii]